MGGSHIKASEYTRPYYALIIDALERGLPIDPHRFTIGDIFAAVYDDQLAPAHGQTPKLQVPAAPFTAVLIPGFINEIFPEAAFSKGMQCLQQQDKLDYLALKIPGRRGSDYNADVIAEQIKNLPSSKPLWLVAHSKGGVDSLHFLAKYPLLAQERVWGLSTIAAPIMGSTYPEHFLLKHLADELIEHQLQAQIDFYPKEIRNSLQPSFRKKWFKENQAKLPLIKYSSLAFQLSKYTTAPTMSLTKIIFAGQEANDGMVDTASASFPEEFSHIDFNIIEADHLIGQSKDPLPQTALLAAHLIMFKYLNLI
jgi:hypothetical protein